MPVPGHASRETVPWSSTALIEFVIHGTELSLWRLSNWREEVLTPSAPGIEMADRKHPTLQWNAEVRASHKAHGL